MAKNHKSSSTGFLGVGALLKSSRRFSPMVKVEDRNQTDSAASSVVPMTDLRSLKMLISLVFISLQSGVAFVFPRQHHSLVMS